MSDPLPLLPADAPDPRATTDALRRAHGVVRGAADDWVLLRHALVRQAALDDTHFSNAVSRHLQVPNGLDGAAHTAMRHALDPLMSAEALAPFHTRFQQIAAGLVAALPRGEPVDAVAGFGTRFAVRAQSAWLGWPAAFEARLVAWVAANQAATRSSERARTQQVAEDFDAIVRAILAAPRPGGGSDLTTRLQRTVVAGRPLGEAEVVSVLRNWTGGDLGSMALCVGVLVQHLASHPALQAELRRGLPDAAFDATIDEILRADDPFVTSRRVTTGPVQIGGVALPAGSRVTLHWTSANRDEAVVGDPDAVNPARPAAHNLVYGAGRHACPGRLLATLQLRIALRALLAATASIAPAPGRPAERAAAPAGGWAAVPVVLA